MEPPFAGIWSKLPGYESDGSDSDAESDLAEFRERAEERLADITDALGDRWTERRFVEFTPAADREAAARAEARQLAARLLARQQPWRAAAILAAGHQEAARAPTFRVQGVEAPILRETLVGNGFRQIKETDSLILWSGSRISDTTYRSLDEFQKVNHFPGSTELTRKDRMWCHFRAMAKKFGRGAFDFIPDTYVLPAQLQDFLACYQRTDWMWIVKPHASSRGRGIFVLRDVGDLPLEEVSVVSRYVHNPLLIQGLKFDLRVYVVVTSFEPLRAYVYREGLVRFASKPYSLKDEHIQDVYRHLTNYSINKYAPNFVENRELENDNVGHKWSFSALNKHLNHEKINVDLMWSGIMDLIVKSLLSVEPSITAKTRDLNMQHPNCFEVYGFDVLVDEALKPWLLEVNLSPSMQADSPLDWQIKSSLLSDVFNLVGIHHDEDRKSGVPPWARTAGPGGFRGTGTAQFPSAAGLGGAAATAPPEAPAPETRDGVAVEPLALGSLSEAQLQALAQALEESRRSHNFAMLYPTRKAVKRYAPITEKWLRSVLPGGAVAPGGVALGASQLLASALFGPRPLPAERPRTPPGSARTGRRAATPEAATAAVPSAQSLGGSLGGAVGSTAAAGVTLRSRSMPLLRRGSGGSGGDGGAWELPRPSSVQLPSLRPERPGTLHGPTAAEWAAAAAAAAERAAEASPGSAAATAGMRHKVSLKPKLPRMPLQREKGLTPSLLHLALLHGGGKLPGYGPRRRLRHQEAGPEEGDIVDQQGNLGAMKPTGAAHKPKSEASAEVDANAAADGDDSDGAAGGGEAQPLPPLQRLQPHPQPPAGRRGGAVAMGSPLRPTGPYVFTTTSLCKEMKNIEL